MSMKVTGNNYFSLSITGQSDEKSKLVSEQVKLEQPIKVDISQEALEKYRKSIQAQNKPSFDEIVKEREMISKVVQPDEQIDYQFKLRYRELNNDGQEFHSTKEIGNNLLKTYVDLYEKIVEYYESGTQERYVTDYSDENGLQFRKLTLEDELEELDTVFKKETELAEEWARGRKESIQTLNDFLKTSGQGVGNSQSQFVQSDKSRELNEKIIKDTIPTDFCEKLWNASRLFIQQYSDSTMRLSE